jgi:hypothetical protein
VVDPFYGRLVTIMRGFSGPFSLAVDEERGLLYVADFRASVVRITELETLAACLTQDAPMPESCEPTVVGIVGTPRSIGDLN